MSLKVYHLRLSQSERVTWLLEELQLPYELHIFDRDPVSALAPAELKALHPAGTAPFFEDTTVDPPVRLGESGAIVQYILSTRAQKSSIRLEPEPGSPTFPEYLNWFHYSNGTLQATIMRSMTLSLAKVLSTPAGERFNQRLFNSLKVIDDHLAANKWLAGNDSERDFTAAEIMMVFSMTTMRGFYPVDLSEYRNVLRWLKDVSERPAYQKAMEKGEVAGFKPMIGAKVEPFRQFPAFRNED